MSKDTLNFNSLVSLVEQTHLHFQQQAVKAVNVSLTIRNYLIGFYIVEFEQNGEDRAAYGEKLLKCIGDKLSSKGLSGTNLKLARQFYQTYPHIGGVLKSSFIDFLPPSIGQTASDLLLCTEKGKQLVEYATAGMDNQLFVSKYLLELPKKEELAAFIQKEIAGWK